MKRFLVIGLVFILCGAMLPSVFALEAKTCIFKRNLYLGVTGEDVKCLQEYLNANGFTISASGFGSPGRESTYFGSKTKSAVARFQQAHSISPTAGYFGPKSRTIYDVSIASGNSAGGVSSVLLPPPPATVTTPPPPPSEKITYAVSLPAPVAGGVVKVGQDYTIKWNINPTPPEDGTVVEVGLEALNGKTKTIIAKNISATSKQYVWRVDAQPALPDRFRIYALFSNPKEGFYTGTLKSGFFTLASPTGTDVLASEAVLKVTAPRRADILTLGVEYPLEWTGGAFAWAVDLTLLGTDAATPARNIVKGIANNGMYNWTPPTDITSGEYVIRVACSSCDKAITDLYDDSKIFSLVK